MNRKTITKNSFWYGVETFIGLFLTLFTSIAIARSVGPERIAYFLYLAWIAGIMGTLGSLGIPATTQKYISEYFGRGQMGIARNVFYQTLRLQTVIGAVVTGVGLLLIWLVGDRHYRVEALLIIGSIFPFMVNSIPAGANTALEDLRANVPASLVSTGIYVVAVFSSIYFGWGLLGVAAGFFAMRAAELVVRLVPLVKRFGEYSSERFDLALSSRMIHFSKRSVILLLLGLIILDRSEMVVLKSFCTDIRQIAFYSVAFNMTERLLVFSQVFGTAAGATIMVQYGRDSSRLRDLAGTSARYLALISFPVHFGMAAIAAPLLALTYGSKYAGAVPALVVAACLGIPKAFFLPVQSLLSSCERQHVIIRWGLVSAALNVALDFALIPRYGALGAALANGVTQTFFALALWIAAVRAVHIDFPILPIAKVAGISAVMAGIVHLALLRSPTVLGLILAIILGVAMYLGLVRITRVLTPVDHSRILTFKKYVPSRARSFLEAGIDWLIVSPESSS